MSQFYDGALDLAARPGAPAQAEEGPPPDARAPDASHGERPQRGARRARTSVEVISDAATVEVGAVFTLRMRAFTPAERDAISPLIDCNPGIARASWTGRGGRRALEWEYDGAAYSTRGIVVKILEMAGRDKDPTGPDYWTVPGTDRSMYEESLRLEREAHASAAVDGP